MPPAPRGRYLRARALHSGCRPAADSSPIRPPDARRRCCATASADSQCRGMRRCSVSMPCSSRKARSGDSVGPERAHRFHPRLHREAEIAEGLVEDARRDSRATARSSAESCRCPSGNLPDSTTMPPIVVPWPPRYFVTEWMTMSAPCSNGRQRYGEASVLSMTSGTPAPCAIVGDAPRVSQTLSCGLPIVSA